MRTRTDDRRSDGLVKEVRSSEAGGCRAYILKRLGRRAAKSGFAAMSSLREIEPCSLRSLLLVMPTSNERLLFATLLRRPTRRCFDFRRSHTGRDHSTSPTVRTRRLARQPIIRRVIALAYGFALATGCTEPSRGEADVVGPDRWHVVLELTDEDIRASDVSSSGTLVVVTDRRIVTVNLAADRDTSSAPMQVDAINAVRVVEDGALFLLGRDCGSVFLIRGTAVEYQHDAARLVRQDTVPPCVSLFSVDAEAPNKVWVVGSHATILAYDGTTWRRESNPVEHLVGAPPPVGSGAYFWSVSARGEKAVIASMRRLLVRDAEDWDTLPPPTTNVPRSCGFRTATFLRSSIIAGGGTPACLVRFKDGEWIDESEEVRSLHDIIFRGRAVGDSASLMWSAVGDVVLVNEQEVRVFYAAALRPFVNAHIYRGSLLLVGQRRRSGLVVEIPLNE